MKSLYTTSNAVSTDSLRLSVPLYSMSSKARDLISRSKLDCIRRTVVDGSAQRIREYPHCHPRVPDPERKYKFSIGQVL